MGSQKEQIRGGNEARRGEVASGGANVSLGVCGRKLSTLLHLWSSQREASKHLSSTLHPVAPHRPGLWRDPRKTEGYERKVTESAAPLGGGGGWEKPADQRLRPPRALHYKMAWKFSPCDFGWPGWSQGQFWEK